MLRKAMSELFGVAAVSKDGRVGSVRDMYFDDVRWAVCHLVIDTGGWLSRHEVLIPPASVARNGVNERGLRVELYREEVEHSPSVEVDKPLPRQLEGLENADGFVEPMACEPHVLSARDVIGYCVEAADGSVGHVEDVIVDDSNWGIVDLIVDTGKWLPGAKVLVPPSAVSDIDWEKRELRLRLTRDEVKAAPSAAR